MPASTREAPFGEEPGGFSAQPHLDKMTSRKSIRGILLRILLISLLPMMALATWQSVARLQHDHDAKQAQLVEAARHVDGTEHIAIADARAVLGILSAIPAVRAGNGNECGQLLQQAARDFTAFSQFSVLRVDGSLACASGPGAVAMMSDARPWRQLQRSGFLVAAGQSGSRPVLSAVAPLTSAEGEFAGAITAAVDVMRLLAVTGEQHASSNIIVRLVDNAGYPVAGSAALPWRDKAVSTTAFGSKRNLIFDVHSPDGVRWSYAVAPLHIDTNGGESFHFVYATAQPARFGPEWWFAVAAFLVPISAILLASAAIWYGANRAILRWVSRLGELARKIGGNRSPDLSNRPSFARAPSEIRDLAADLLRMNHTIIDREQRLLRSVSAQSAVARELNHRVRNNLQVISSFLSLQAQALASGKARNALDEARLRIATMAMVNGMLYEDDEVTTIAMAQLFQPIAELLTKYTGHRGEIAIDGKLVTRNVGIDQAMPLSLWIIEAAVCLFERADPAGIPCVFTIGITHEADAICIVVEVCGLMRDRERSSLHRRLVVAIAHQLGGRSRIDEVSPSVGKIVLCLPDEVLTAETQRLPADVECA